MRFQVEGIYQGRPISPKVVEGSSAEAVRRAAEARGLKDVVVFPADDPFGQVAQPVQPTHRRANNSIAVTAAGACGLLFLWLAYCYWSAPLEIGPPDVATDFPVVPAEGVAPEPTPPPAPDNLFPGGRDEAKYGPIFARIREAQGEAHAAVMRAFGDEYTGPADPAKEAHWKRTRDIYSDERYFEQFHNLSAETGLTLDELLDIDAEGRARAWFAPPKKRTHLTTEEMKRRYEAYTKANAVFALMFARKMEAEYPSTPIHHEEPRVAEAKQDLPTEAPPPDPNDAARKKAIRFTQMAEAMTRSGKKEQAREYAKKAFEAAPAESEERKRAKELLDGGS